MTIGEEKRPTGLDAVTDGRDAILLEAAPPHDRQARSPTISDDAFPDPLAGHSPVMINPLAGKKKARHRAGAQNRVLRR